MDERIKKIVPIDVLLKIGTEYCKGDFLNIDFIKEDLDSLDIDNMTNTLNSMYNMNLDADEDEDFLIEVIDLLISNCITIETFNGIKLYIFAHDDMTYVIED